jgi:hypothetical protein
MIESKTGTELQAQTLGRTEIKIRVTGIVQKPKERRAVILP